MTLTEWIFRSLALLLVLLAGLAIAWGFLADRVRGRTKQPRCPKCWYDLSGVVEHEASKWRCSECGFVATRIDQLHKGKKKWWTLAPALLFIAVSPLAWAWPTIDRDGWRAAVPTWAIVYFWPIDETAWAESAGGGDMAYELDRRIDTNLVSVDLLDAWAKRVEKAYNRPRVLRGTTLGGEPMLERIDLRDLMVAMDNQGLEFIGEPKAATAADEMEFRNRPHSNSPIRWPTRTPRSAVVPETLQSVMAIVSNYVARESWALNGGIDGAFRGCGTSILIVNSREAIDRSKSLIAATTSVLRQANGGDTGASVPVFDEGGYRVVVRDVGDVPLMAARPDAWAEDRAAEVCGRLIDAIEPDSWFDNGGSDGVISRFDRLLIIRHTPEVQSRIDEQLKQWRAEAAALAK